MSPGGDTELDNLGKNGKSARKSSLTRSRSALEARDWSQYPTAIIPMLRLLAQLLWSSEIQLFDGEALERIDLQPEPRLEGGGGESGGGRKITKKLKKSQNFVSQNHSIDHHVRFSTAQL